MKYMGSKRWMLKNGLGDLIAREVGTSSRFVDLFAGSAAVVTHVATRYPVKVAAYDLQAFSAVLSQAIIGRERQVDAAGLWADWHRKALFLRNTSHPPSIGSLNRGVVREHRQWCAKQDDSLITRAYGGHYFSASQSVWLDALRIALPEREPERGVALAAMLWAASQCAASPGHTAQPFQLTRTAKPFLMDAWNKCIVDHCRNALFAISIQHAKVIGHAEVADANEAATLVEKGDLVFIDPPYSGVHYSRFYHVLETISRGKCGAVSGRGRYPAPDERPRSKYSLKSDSKEALDDLFAKVSLKKGNCIVTFPQRLCSNGLSGGVVIKLAKNHFEVEQHWVASKFSTLGGNNDHRDARRSTRELILVLRSH